MKRRKFITTMTVLPVIGFFPSLFAADKSPTAKTLGEQMKETLEIQKQEVLNNDYLTDPDKWFVAPTTANELYHAINTLGVKHPEISKKMYEEIGKGENMRRYSHNAYRVWSVEISSRTEKRLVGYMWKEMQDIFKKQDNPLIVWRRLPEYSVKSAFSNSRKEAALVMRLSIGHENIESSLIHHGAWDA